MVFENLVLPKEVKTIEETSTYGKFVAEPYESGLGHTVGNSLRRILLSGLEGAAVTAAKITGVTHEFATVSHVKEDVIQILLNLKKLRVKLDENLPKVVLELSANKAGAVTANDIKEKSGVEIINKDLQIATLEAGGKLEMEIEISHGRGYSEENINITRPAGFIPIDSIFSPILKVHYDVEPARVGQKTDYDRLIIEITTDGTLEPSVALHQAAVRLTKSLRIFTKEGHEADFDEEEGVEVQEDSNTEEPKNEVLEQSVEILDLSPRSLNCLKTAKITTIGELVAKTEKQLSMVKNFGQRSLEEVKGKLAELKLKLAEDK